MKKIDLARDLAYPGVTHLEDIRMLLKSTSGITSEDFGSEVDFEQFCEDCVAEGWEASKIVEVAEFLIFGLSGGK